MSRSPKIKALVQRAVLRATLFKTLGTTPLTYMSRCPYSNRLHVAQLTSATHYFFAATCNLALISNRRVQLKLGFVAQIERHTKKKKKEEGGFIETQSRSLRREEVSWRIGGYFLLSLEKFAFLFFLFTFYFVLNIMYWVIVVV